MDGPTLTKRNEGLRLVAYDDATGHPVEAGGECKGTLSIGFGHTGADVYPGLEWDEATALRVFDHDYSVASGHAALVAGVQCWRRLDVCRRAVLVDMAFELGGHGLAEFVKMIVAVRAYQWPDAAAALVASRLDAEAPKREARNAYILRVGSWPPPDMW